MANSDSFLSYLETPVSLEVWVSIIVGALIAVTATWLIVRKPGVRRIRLTIGWKGIRLMADSDADDKKTKTSPTDTTKEDDDSSGSG